MKRRSDTLLNLFLLFDEDEESALLQMLPLIKRKKTHEMIKNRDTEGSYFILVRKYLLTEDDKFVQYFRVSPKIFYKILEKISDEILSAPYNRVKKPISSEQKLCVALRYLATGESIASLAFSYRISKSWISHILKEVFQAIKTKFFDAIPPPTKENFIR